MKRNELGENSDCKVLDCDLARCKIEKSETEMVRTKMMKMIWDFICFDGISFWNFNGLESASNGKSETARHTTRPRDDKGSHI